MRAGLDKRVLEGALLALASVVLAVAWTWPLTPDISSRVPNTLVDSPYKVWEIGWIGDALTDRPLDLYDSNAFWPRDGTLAFGDAMIGTGPFTWVADGFRSSVVEYNVVFLLAYALAFAGAYLLARELGVGPPAAAVAGAAFAFAPWRASQASHLHVLMSGGVALSLFLLLRGYRSARARTVAAGWLVAICQLTLGFTIGLQLAYLLAVLGVAAVVLGRRRIAVPPRIVWTTVVCAVAFTVAGALLALPYLEVARDYPQAERSAMEVATFSPLPQSFLAAPEPNLVWGDATGRVRDTLRVPNEQSLFAGLGTLVLALVGLGAQVLPRWSRIALAAAGAVTALLSLGLHPSLGALEWLLPYRLLYEFAPGWDGVRTPGRIFTLTSLALAVLAAGGAHAVARRSARPTAVALALAAVVLVEGYARIPYPHVPAVPRGQLGLPTPQLHVPTDPQRDSLYMMWSTEGFPPILNGYSGFPIPELDRVRTLAHELPSERSARELRRFGVRVVVVHPELARGTDWERLVDAEAPKGVRVERREDVVVYHLAP